MARLDPLPDDVVRRPARSAALRCVGVGARELAGPLWGRGWRGVRAWSGLDPLDPITRVRAAALLLPPGAALGGWAALRARGAGDLDGLVGLTGRLRPVLVCVGPVERMTGRPGLVVDRGTLDPGEVTVADGVPVVSPERAIGQVARRDGAEAGLAAADSACRWGLTTPPRIRAFVAAQARRPGVPAMRVVAALVDPGAASVPESHLRYVWVVAAGLPPPLVNVEVVDARAGWLAGLPDLLDPSSGLAAEYDGAHHRGLEQHTADNIREETFERLNLTVVRATALDLWGRRAELIGRLQAGYADALARDQRRDRWGVGRSRPPRPPRIP